MGTLPIFYWLSHAGGISPPSKANNWTLPQWLHTNIFIERFPCGSNPKFLVSVISRLTISLYLPIPQTLHRRSYLSPTRSALLSIIDKTLSTSARSLVASGKQSSSFSTIHFLSRGFANWIEGSSGNWTSRLNPCLSNSWSLSWFYFWFYSQCLWP